MTREEGNKGGEQNKVVQIRTKCTSIEHTCGMNTAVHTFQLVVHASR